MPEDKHTAPLDWSDPETKRQYMKKWRAENREKRRESKRRYVAEHPEYKPACDRRHYELRIKTDPAKLAKISQASKDYDAAHPEQHKARCDRFRESHREILAENAKAAYHAKSEDERKALRLARAEYFRAWHEANSESLAEYRAKRHDENKAEFNARSRAYYQQNKLPFIKRANYRRTLLTGTYTQADLDALYAAQRGRCPACKLDLHGVYTIDHMMPLALDPTGDVLENLQLMCSTCNHKKYNKTPAAWAAYCKKHFA
jgi:5-methylcytosine-specific restriction endonuclease McrA